MWNFKLNERMIQWEYTEKEQEEKSKNIVEEYLIQKMSILAFFARHFSCICEHVTLWSYQIVKQSNRSKSCTSDFGTMNSG